MEPSEIDIIKIHIKKYLKIPKKIKGEIKKIKIKGKSGEEIEEELEEEEVKNEIEEIANETYQKINVFITVKNQNLYQKIYVSINIFLEFMRVITCSLLILFIPEQCGNNRCAIYEKIYFNSIFYSFVLICNFLTLLYFCFFYFLEIKRENILIKYLDVNPSLPYDKTDVKSTLDILPIENKNKIIHIHKIYKKYANFLILICVINTILSGFIVSNSNIPNQSLSSFITYVLFLFIKLNNVYSTANTRKYIFYSAYLSSNVQFNDIDKQYKKSEV
jgi:hypothetical protein